jgi:putative ABC transport system permease protein
MVRGAGGLNTMLRPRWNKVLSDLWGNKIRSVLVIASIAVGLFAVGIIANLHVIINEDMETGYLNANPANIQISSSAFDQEMIDHIAKLPGVKQAEGVRITTLRVHTHNGEWKPISIIAIPNIEAKQINRISLEQGAWPPKKRQIVVDAYKAGELPVSLGGFIEVELPSGRLRELELVGISNDQTLGSVGTGGFFLAPITGYVTEDTLAWLELPATNNHLYVTADNDGSDICCSDETLLKLSNQIRDELESSGILVFSTYTRASDNHPNRIYVRAIASVLFLLGFLVVFLSGFLITNTLQALLSQQIHQIGIMKALGARRNQISIIYMVLIFLFGLVAFGVAMPLAARFSYVLAEDLTSKINMQVQGFRFVPFSIMLQLVIALIVPQAAGYFPIFQGTRISTIEALDGLNRARPPEINRWLDRKFLRFKSLPRPLLLSLRNTFRRKGRLALTLITLSLGGAIFIATFNTERSLSLYIEQIGHYFLADVNLTLSKSYRINEVKQSILEIPEVAGVEGWGIATAEIILPDGSGGGTSTFLAPPENSKLVQASLLEGRWLLPGDDHAIVVNELYRDIFPDLKIGDEITFKFAGKETDLQVIGFFQLAGRIGGKLAYTTYEYLSREINQVNRTSAYRITGRTPHPSLEQQKALGSLIETKLKASGFEISEITAGLALTETTSDGLNILTTFLLIMASLVAIVGSIGLTGTMSLNVMERTREIGIMRAIGATDKILTRLVLSEGIFIGLMSWVLGTIISFPISSMMSNAINYSLFGVTTKFTFTPTGILLWLIIVLILSIFASLGPARNASRLTIREVLAYE